MEDHPEYAGEKFAEGLKMRRQVLGAEYVDSSMARADEFMRAFQKITTEHAWADIWARPGLPPKTRSMLNLAMLTALNRPNELKLHVRGALTNGVTRDEIKEILLQTCVYCGIPAGLDAFKSAAEIFKEVDAKAAS
jgi:4-carboxymuconolactone decarboxylase